MPVIRREQPAHLQIAEDIKRQIQDGILRPRDKVDSVRKLAKDSGVGQNTAQRAIGLLMAERLVYTNAQGTFVSEQRIQAGPQDRLRMPDVPDGETQVVTAAGIVDAPEYVLPILRLSGTQRQVVRREWVTYDHDQQPVRLSVSWLPQWTANSVPELLVQEPLPGPLAARLVCERSGLMLTTGRVWREARAVKNDGREARHLGLNEGDHVLAETITWPASSGVMVEYIEYIVPENHVLDSEIEPYET